MLVPFAVLVVGCSGGNRHEGGDPTPPGTSETGEKGNAPKADTGAPAGSEKFADDIFKVPPYPGAKIMEFTSLEMDSDVSHSYNRHYNTKDSVDKVAEHFMTEGAKVGKLADTGRTNKPGALLRVVVVEFGPKEKLDVQVMNLPKDNSTDISVHLIKSKN